MSAWSGRSGVEDGTPLTRSLNPPGAAQQVRNDRVGMRAGLYKKHQSCNPRDLIYRLTLRPLGVEVRV